MQRRITARGIIYKNGTLLCQQLVPDHNGKARDYWCTPGGGLDDSESILDAVHREMIEETGVTPNVGRLLFVQQYFDGEQEEIEFFFHIENADDYSSIDLSKTSHGQLEIKNVGFVDPKSTNVLPKFLTEIDIESFISGQNPPLVVSEL
jgi:ADP-ribose pyrophosphatase YjhB (NUDIX family)